MFTLVGDTRGGPPVDYTWTRDGVEIINGITFEGGNPVDSLYRSKLTVVGRYPGEYAYVVSNRVTVSNVSASFIIQGM